MKVKIRREGMTLKFKYEEINTVLKILEKKAEENKALKEVNKWPEKEEIKTVRTPDYISDICHDLNEMAKDVYKNDKKEESKKEKTINELKKAVAVKNNCKDYEEFEINRKIVKLRDYDGLSFARIGKLVGYSAATVQKRYHQMKGDKDGGAET